MVASTTKKLYEKLSNCKVLPAVTDNRRPANPSSMPIIFCLLDFKLKKAIPAIMVKSGVSAFKMPASALSILVSAIQNK